jgi:mRNA interferase MazF
MEPDRRGEVWLIDLGYVAKTRPAVVISIPSLDTERALVAVVPHTTSQRGTRFEIASNVHFLKSGVFDAQNIITVPKVKLLRRLGALSNAEFATVVDAVLTWLGLSKDI